MPRSDSYRWPVFTIDFGLFVLTEGGDTLGEGRSGSIVNSLTVSFGTKSYEIQLVLFDPEWNVVQEELFKVKKGAPVQFEFGWGYTDGTRETMVYTGLFFGADPKFDVDGVTITMDFTTTVVFSPLHLSTEGTAANKKPIVIPPGVLVSDAIMTILGAEAEKFEEIQIEPSKTKTSAEYKQQNMTPMKFIEFLIKNTSPANEKGEQGYVLMILPGLSGDIFRCSTRMYKSGEVNRSFVFGKSVDGNVISFSAEDTTTVANILWGRVQTRMEDAIQGAQEAQIADSKKGAGPTPADTTSSVKVVRSSVGKTGVDPGSAPTSLVTVESAQRKATDAKREAVEKATAAQEITGIRGTLEIIGDAEILWNTFISLTVLATKTSKDGKVSQVPYSVFSGPWRIEGVTHTIGPGSFTTSLSIIRDLSKQTFDAAVGAVPTVKDESKSANGPIMVRRGFTKEAKK